MKKRFLLAAVCVGFLSLLASCGGGGGDQFAVASSNATATITSANGVQVVSSVLNQAFVYDTGVPEFGTTGSTTLTYTPQTATNVPDNTAPAQPGFKIASASGSASGVADFGSCKYRVTSSTYTTGPLTNGQTVTISNCQLVVSTLGIPADGQPHTLTASLALNSRVSKVISVQVTIQPNGTVIINNFQVTTVPTKFATGA